MIDDIMCTFHPFHTEATRALLALVDSLRFPALVLVVEVRFITLVERVATAVWSLLGVVGLTFCRCCYVLLLVALCFGNAALPRPNHRLTTVPP